MTFDEALKSLSSEAKDKLKECKSLDEMVKIFKDNNININQKDLQSVVQKQGELSDDDLANVVGGIDLSFLVQELLKYIIDKIKS